MERLGNPRRRPLRTRARVVCEACHTRKVKCDLQQQLGSVCSNCQRSDQPCRLRVPERRLSLGGSIRASSSTRLVSRSSHRELPSTSISMERNMVSNRAGQSGSRKPSETQTNLAYLGECIIPYATPSSSGPLYQSSLPSTIQTEYLKLSGALDLPSKIMQEALKDNYFKYMYHHCPFVDHRHLQNPSILMAQVVCLAGYSMRPMSRHYASSCEHLYLKVKTLLMTNHEKDLAALLQSLAIFCYWNITPMQAVSLESAHHWTCIGVRLLYQAGLHREQTYATICRPGVLRRIAWNFFIVDTMHSSILGLPSMTRLADFQIRQLEPGDFETFNDKAQFFVEYIKLNALHGKMSEVRRQKGEIDTSQAAYRILREMKEWIEQLPEHLRLYQGSDQRSYNREVYELHISYFIVIVKFFHSCGHAVHATITNPTALIASSCIAQLYEELLCRDDIGYLLPMHNWSISVGCLPQIHALSGRFYGDTTCEEELNTLRRALRTMSIKWPQARNLEAAIALLQEKRAADSKSDRSRIESRDCDAAGTALYGFIRDLFPFPESMCPRMAMLDSIDPISGHTESVAGSIDAEQLMWAEDYDLTNWALDMPGPSGSGEMFGDPSTLYGFENSLNF